MTATAVSKIVRIRGTGIRKMEIEALIVSIAFPKRVISRCPAIRFAVSRTHKVMGRIKFLVSSIRTMNLMRATGVPCGTKCASMWFVFLIQPNRLMVNHLSKARGRVTTRCEVKEKICGNRAVAFIIKIMVNKVMMYVSSPFFVLFRVNATSFSRKLRNLPIAVFLTDLFIQE